MTIDLRHIPARMRVAWALMIRREIRRALDFAGLGPDDVGRAQAQRWYRHALSVARVRFGGAWALRMAFTDASAVVGATLLAFDEEHEDFDVWCREVTGCD